MSATRSEDAREINFAVRTVAKKTHGAKKRYRMPDNLKNELEILRNLMGDKTIRPETPFVYIFPRDWDFEAGCYALAASLGC